MTDLLTDTELAEIERLTKLHIGDRPPWGNTILRLVGEVMRLRAAEQPPTPPAGRGEERERIESIRKLLDSDHGLDKYAFIAMLRNLLAAVDSRDAVIAALVKAAGEFLIAYQYGADPNAIDIGEMGLQSALAAARPFTKEPR